MEISTKFWRLLNELVATSDIIIDRPKGTSHPRFPNLIYPMDYGYLATTQSSDGDEVDIWLGSLDTKHITGIVCTVDTEDRDVEIKVLFGCTPKEIRTIIHIHNQGTQSAFFVEQKQ